MASAFADCASTNPDVASVCASFSCAAAFELAASSLAAQYAVGNVGGAVPHLVDAAERVTVAVGLFADSQNRFGLALYGLDVGAVGDADLVECFSHIVVAGGPTAEYVGRVA